MITEAVLAVLTLIEQLLPLLGVTTSAQTVTLIGNIINALIKFMPLITDEVSSVYTAVKNIINSLSSNPAATPEQLAALQSLDAQVDAAWTAIEGQLDPDAPGTTT
jgi:uncharacterized membrane protein